MGSIIAIAAAWLTAESSTVRRVVPTTLTNGLKGVVTSIAIKRYVLIAILIGLAVFGTDSHKNEENLSKYVTNELGIETPVTKSDDQ
jgi:hypothetical protein